MFLRNRDRGCRAHFGSAIAQKALHAVGLDTFDAIWELEADWVEEPNFRRSGWSGVCRVLLPMGGQEITIIYIKRQQGHCFRALRHGFLSRPTAYREYVRLSQLKVRGIAAPEVIYYGERRYGKHPQAILITREVPHCLTLDEYLQTAAGRTPQEVDRLIRDTAVLVHSLHRIYLQHSSLYGKHILIANAGKSCPGDACADRQIVPHLIDLEKSRYHISRNAIAVHDLSQLFRHTPWVGAQWDAFIQHYRSAGRMWTIRGSLADRVARKVRAKAARKRREDLARSSSQSR